MQLAQARIDSGDRVVLAIDDDPTQARRLEGVESVHALALTALERGVGLSALIDEWPGDARVDAVALSDKGQLLAPLDHPDPAHLLVTGTGLTHLGSAEGRDKMHRQMNEADQSEAPLTDSMKMFRKGLEGGKPAGDDFGVQPEWFYKGDGGIVMAPGEALNMPHFALDGGEEPEVAGLYLIDNNGVPRRIGYALGNEFSDHVTERENYLYLAHSKLRVCSFGPTLLVDELPSDVQGTSRIRRDGGVLWEKPFISGEDNMCHSLANLEAHHFKYAQFCRPGDVHVHFFGTATLSFSDGISAQPGDVFEIDAKPFALPLRNPLAKDATAPVPRVKPL
ncbi:AraD1 family protein [Chromohalobacter nigrandesensis]|uniref:AraD1 family protein n=1 Tax=Chromohalobacter nigrandesensis TaxID=119863 RepID=UPI001FF13BBD|nr:AraD1 family protein [Chromohalobacter nigrandesensis]MCK0744318.1 FAH family protein [Chromohalobacter nigrandesensis]